MKNVCIKKNMDKNLCVYRGINERGTARKNDKKDCYEGLPYISRPLVMPFKSLGRVTGEDVGVHRGVLTKGELEERLIKNYTRR